MLFQEDPKRFGRNDWNFSGSFQKSLEFLNSATEILRSWSAEIHLSWDLLIVEVKCQWLTLDGYSVCLVVSVCLSVSVCLCLSLSVSPSEPQLTTSVKINLQITCDKWCFESWTVKFSEFDGGGKRWGSQLKRYQKLKE